MSTKPLTEKKQFWTLDLRNKHKSCLQTHKKHRKISRHFFRVVYHIFPFKNPSNLMESGWKDANCFYLNSFQIWFLSETVNTIQMTLNEGKFSHFFRPKKLLYVSLISNRLKWIRSKIQDPNKYRLFFLVYFYMEYTKYALERYELLFICKRDNINFEERTLKMKRKKREDMHRHLATTINGDTHRTRTSFRIIRCKRRTGKRSKHEIVWN